MDIQAQQKQAQSARVSLQIVESVVDNTCVSVEWLRSMTCHLTPETYDDIVDERHCINLCSLPLCPNSPAVVGKNQLYSISYSRKKVYDMRQLKKFCSIKCWSSSNHYRSQIPTTIVWTRSEAECKAIVANTVFDFESSSCPKTCQKVSSHTIVREPPSEPSEAPHIVQRVISETGPKLSSVDIIRDWMSPESRVLIAQRFDENSSTSVYGESYIANRGDQSVRQKILLQTLESSLKKMPSELSDMDKREVRHRWQLLISTFNLTAENVVPPTRQRLPVALLMMALISHEARLQMERWSREVGSPLSSMISDDMLTELSNLID